MHQPQVIQQAIHMKVEPEWDVKEFHELVKDESWAEEVQDLKEEKDLEEEQA